MSPPDEARGTGHGASSKAENGTEAGWKLQQTEAEYTRLERVQSAANVWLGILGTLFTLSGAVVLVQGSTAFILSSDITWLHLLLIALVVVTFAAAILALMMGGAATWGGLENPADIHRPPAHALLDKLIKNFSRSDERKKIIRESSDQQSDKPWAYANMYNKSANRRRVYLQYSRFIGIIAASLAAVLVIWIFIAGTISKGSPDVIVVHQGRVTCAPVSNADEYVGVTQVIAVAQC